MNHDGKTSWSEDGSKYGPLQATKYVTTSHFTKVFPGGTNLREDVVMGGDTMCQRTYTKIAGTPLADVDFDDVYLQQRDAIVEADMPLHIKVILWHKSGRPQCGRNYK